MVYAKKSQRNNSRNLLLEIFKAGGALTLIFTVPGAAPYFMKPFMNGEDLDEERFERAINRLKKSELIGIEEEDGGVTLHLTKDGEKKALRYSLDEMVLEKPEKWDGKWRIIMFDIPDEKKVARNYFKQKLDDLRFITIQKSVYAHPYPCEEQIELIRSVYDIRPFVKIITATHFEGDEKYLAKFGLGR